MIAGARRNEEYLYDTVIDSFNTVFTDTMSLQKAKAEFCSLKMERGELDTYSEPVVLFTPSVLFTVDDFSLNSYVDK